MTVALPGAAGAAPPHRDMPPVPRHRHAKIIGLEERDGMVRYRRCIELPEVPNHAHHRMLHTGHAGGPNNIEIPLAPLSPFRDCGDIARLIGPPGVWFPDPGSGPPPGH